MTTKEYCAYVESKDLFHKQLEYSYPIKEDNSPMVSLLDSDLNLIFEPSVMKGYEYLVRRPILEKIDRISHSLDELNKVLVIRSAWRSFKHQEVLRRRKASSLQKEHPEKTPEQIDQLVSYFIAPTEKSTHATGGAIDALIYDNKTKQVLDFGSNKGYSIDLNERCYPYYPDISIEAKANRKLLINLFEEEDFVCDLKEFWHFDFGNVGWAIEKGIPHANYGIIGQ